MWADLALSGATSLMKQGMAYQAAATEAKSKRQWQVYKNAMTKMADANNQNALTTNELLLEDRTATQRFGIERSKYVTTASVEASAAAADTEGRSVNMVMFDIERNASMQQANVTSDLEAQRLSIDEQRRASAWQAETNMDRTFIPKPNLATYALGFATDLGKSYNQLNKV